MWQETSRTQGVKYYYENSRYRKVLFAPLKKSGFVPEKGSEIYVSNIPEETSIYDLAKFFEQAGQVFQVRLMMRSNNQHNRGFAYVTYFNKEFAINAIDNLKNKPFFANLLLNMQKSVDNCRVFLGGIPTNKTKDDVWHELISTYRIKNVVDVITYRSYGNPTLNRGYAFLEFKTHEEASYFRAKYSGKLILWGKSILVDWAIPIMEPDEGEMAEVKIIYLRNLNVIESSEDFNRKIHQLIPRSKVDKVYKFKDYSYIHLKTRKDAEWLMDILQKYYQHTDVEITWAKPPNKFNDPKYRHKALLTRRHGLPNEELFYEYTMQPSTSSSEYRMPRAVPKTWKTLDHSQNYCDKTSLSELPPFPVKHRDLYSEILLKDFSPLPIKTRNGRMNSESSLSHQSGSSYEELTPECVLNHSVPFEEIESFYDTFQCKHLLHSDMLQKAYREMSENFWRSNVDKHSNVYESENNLRIDEESFSFEEQLEALARDMLNTVLED